MNDIDTTITYLETTVMQRINEHPWRSGSLYSEYDGSMCLIGYLGVNLDSDGKNYVAPNELVSDAVLAVSSAIHRRGTMLDPHYPISECYRYNDRHIQSFSDQREECRKLIKEAVDVLRMAKE